MEAFLAAVKKSMLILLGVTLAVFVLALPRPANRPLIGALKEMTAFRGSFDRTAAEQGLRAQAEARGALALTTVEAALRGKRGPKLVLDPQAKSVRPLSVVNLATLEQVEAHAQPASLPTGVPEVEALASSIHWRLMRTEQAGPFTLTGVELTHAEVGAADVALEREVASLRTASLDARAAVEATEARMPTLEQRVEFQTKNRSKYLGKSIMALKEARDLLVVQQQTHSDTQQKYDQAAKRAEAPRKAQGAPGVPGFAIANVTLTSKEGGRTFAIPVPLTLRQVPVGALSGASFPATHGADLWDEVKTQDAAQAVDSIRGHFNWHMHGMSMGNFELLGAHLLQLVPCILPFLLLLVLRHIRRARTSYNPFTTEVPEKEPRIGLSNRALEFLVLLALPALATGNAVAAIFLVGQMPVLPVLCLLAVLFMGGSAFKEVNELREQTLSIVRSHSNLPPAPSAAKL